MSFDPEENLLDESLREVFRDYHLPPAEHMHVWDGVEKRIATLAAPRKSLLSYHLVLPLTAALGVGVAVGWLLPRPVAPPPPPQAVPAVRATTWAPTASPQVAPAPVALAAPDVRPTATAVLAGRHLASTRKHQESTRQPAAQAPIAGAPVVVSAPAPDSVTREAALPGLVASAPGLASDDSSGATTAADSAAPATHSETGTIEAAAPAEATMHTAKAAKLSGVNERMLYRKPTHRQPERGVGGIRRWVSHLTQSIRHLFQ